MNLPDHWLQVINTIHRSDLSIIRLYSKFGFEWCVQYPPNSVCIWQGRMLSHIFQCYVQHYQEMVCASSLSYKFALVADCQYTPGKIAISIVCCLHCCTSISEYTSISKKAIGYHSLLQFNPQFQLKFGGCTNKHLQCMLYLLYTSS